VRRRACLAIADDPAGALLCEALQASLDDSDRSVARAASDALVRLRARVPDLEAQLRERLRARAAAARWATAYTLARLAPPDPGLLPAIVEAMAAPESDVRWAAARLLVDLGRLHPEVLRVVIGLARAADQVSVRRMAVFALRELAPDEPLVAEAVLEASRDRDVELRRAALSSLAKLIAPPRAVLERLLEAQSTAAVERSLALVSLGELCARDPALLVPRVSRALEEARQSSDPDVKRAAERACQRAGIADSRSQTGESIHA
jgi:hypothetical protein